MKGCVGMGYLSYEEQMLVLADFLRKETQALNELPPDKKKKKQTEDLIKVGILGEDGKLTAPYAALRV